MTINRSMRDFFSFLILGFGRRWNRSTKGFYFVFLVSMPAWEREENPVIYSNPEHTPTISVAKTKKAKKPILLHNYFTILEVTFAKRGAAFPTKLLSMLVT